jgi:hypothetical protein
MSNSTVAYLKDIMPGQPDAWYDRIAGEILSGKMPLPKVDSIPVPEPERTQSAAPYEVKPKSKTQQLKQGTYQHKPLTAPPAAHVPSTVSEALQQASKKRQSKPASAAIKWKLEALVHGDKKAAERLVAQIALKYADKSDQWCWEKALHDLERDRHA